MQAELVFSSSAKNGDCFKLCSWTFVKIAQLHMSCIATPQQCTWTFVTYYIHTGLLLENSEVLNRKQVCRLWSLQMIMSMQMKVLKVAVLLLLRRPLVKAAM
jgi:hypothetical protein